jgi:hypothetical protein
MSKVNIFALIIGIAVLVFSLFQLNAYSGTVVETYSKLTTDKDYKIPYIQIEDTSTTPFATALIVHGVMENRTTMKHIATSLAHLGIDVYVIDLPGYGSSTIPFTEQELNYLHSISFFYRWLENNDKILNNNFILIGHSIGAEAVVRASVDKDSLLEASDELQYTPDQIKLNLKYLIPEADTTILISHFPNHLISRNSPKNIFMLIEGLGGGDTLDKVKDFINKDNLDLSSDDEQAGNEYSLQFSSNNTFKTKFYPPANSLDIVYRQDVINDISKWIINYYNIDLTTLLYYNPSTLRNLSLIGILISFFLLIFPISELTSKLWLFDFKSPREPYRTDSYSSILFKKLFSLIVAGGLSMIFILFGFIQIEIVDFITTVFLYQFIIDLFIFRNYIFTAAKYDAQVPAKMVLALIISGVLYLLIGIISNMYITDIMFIPTRLWRFAIVYGVFILYFVGDEFLYRTPLVRYNSDIKTYIKSFLLSFIDKALIMVGVFLISYFYHQVDFELLVKFTVVTGILLVLMQIVSVYLFRKIKSYYVTGFINAFIMAWVITAITPITA